MLISYHNTTINAKQVLKITKDVDTQFVTTEVVTPRKWWFNKVENVVSEKTTYYVELLYVDIKGERAKFTWSCYEEQPVQEAYNSLVKQLKEQQDAVTDKVIEKALMGESSDAEKL